MSKLCAHGKRTAALLLAVAAALAAVLAVGAGSIVGSSSAKAAGWRLLPPSPISIHAGQTGVWTGEELIVAGLTSSPDGTLIGADEVAAAYRPATNTWRRLPAAPKSESYCRRSAVWTGSEMVVWGCVQVAFNPRTNRWRRLPPAPTGAPGLVVWTGRELIGWGGGCCGDAFADGAAFDPATDNWRKLAPSPLAPSQSPVSAWTGRELIVFVSGLDPDGERIPGAARAAAYNPTKDTWRPIAPAPTRPAAAVWDGREILLVGAAGSGYAYDPATDSWRSLSPTSSGSYQAAAAWTGNRLLLFGGEATPDQLLSYDPRRNRWSQLTTAPLTPRTEPAVVWTGRELIVWGGVIGTPAGKSTPPEHRVDGAAFNPSSQGSRGGGQ